MKKNIQLIVASLLFVLAAEIQALELCVEEPFCCEVTDNKKWYAKLFSGANFLQDTSISGNNARYRTGYIISGSLGYHWCNGLSLEAEYAYRRNAISEIDFISEGSSNNGHFQTASYMANLLWDLPFSWRCIHPFVGAGIGYDSQRMHSSNDLIIFDQKWHHFAWQLMAGVSYPFYCNTELTVEYRFHQGGCDFNNHSLGVGLSYNFEIKRGCYRLKR